MTSEAARLYGRERAIGLVREFLSRPERDGVPRSRRVPVMVFTGPRGSGKTALLAELAHRLDQNVPFAHVDCETTETTETTDATDTAGAAQAAGGNPDAEMLAALAFELNRQCGRYGRLGFPRLVTARLAIAQHLDMTDRDRAREQVRLALVEYRRVDRLRDFLAASAPKVLSTVPGVGGLPGVSTAGRYLPDLVLRGLVSWRGGRRVVLGEGQDWFGHQDRGLGRNPLDVLVDLNRAAVRLAAQPDVTAHQREVGDLLWAAFLADLRHDFRTGPRADEWSLNCVVLLDNVDHDAGLRFLDGLITARRQHAAHAADDPDPLTVVATSRGALPARVVAAGEVLPTAERAGHADYLERNQRRPERGWYPVLLRDLTGDEVGNMVAALGLTGAGPDGPGDDRQVAAAVHGFTGGHPGTTRLLLDAIAEQPGDRLDLPAVLAAPEPGVLGPTARTTEDRMRTDLLRGVPAAVVDDLVTCAAARDLDQASRLDARAGLLTGPRGQRAALFAPVLWQPPVDRTGPAEVHPVLRRLLLRRLAARPDDHPASWGRVHGWLRRDRAEAGDEAGALYHALALGAVEVVTRRLGELLPATPVADWLALLRAVTAAPNRVPPSSEPVAQVRALTGWADPGDLPTGPLARLVAALWLAGDPLGDRRQRGLHLEVAADLNDVAPYSADGLAVLRGEAERHHVRATASA